jgi:hypothetical protein
MLRSGRKIDRILAARTLAAPQASRRCDDTRLRAAAQNAFFCETSESVKKLLATALARLVSVGTDGDSARLDQELAEALRRLHRSERGSSLIDGDPEAAEAEMLLSILGNVREPTPSTIEVIWRCLHVRAFLRQDRRCSGLQSVANAGQAHTKFDGLHGADAGQSVVEIGKSEDGAQELTGTGEVRNPSHSDDDREWRSKMSAQGGARIHWAAVIALMKLCQPENGSNRTVQSTRDTGQRGRVTAAFQERVVQEVTAVMEHEAETLSPTAARGRQESDSNQEAKIERATAAARAVHESTPFWASLGAVDSLATDLSGEGVEGIRRVEVQVVWEGAGLARKAMLSFLDVCLAVVARELSRESTRRREQAAEALVLLPTIQAPHAC